MPTCPHILIVEDDAPLAALMAQALTREGYTVTLEPRGDRAVGQIETLRPQLVLLDLMLPGLDGVEVCKRARRSYSGRIIMITAKESDADQILGLEVGADDYIVKPVPPKLLMARVKAHIRRAQQSEGLKIEVEGLTIDPSTRSASVAGKPLELTTSELDLLLYLAARPGQILSRQEIYLALRGIEHDGVDRSIDLRVSKIRSQLRAAGLSLNFIKTVHGKGYLFALNPDDLLDGRSPDEPELRAPEEAGGGR
jgi:DNA-binding response OmpR family regulator